jgi:hypothetical protein
MQMPQRSARGCIYPLLAAVLIFYEQEALMLRNELRIVKGSSVVTADSAASSTWAMKGRPVDDERRAVSISCAVDRGFRRRNFWWATMSDHLWRTHVSSRCTTGLSLVFVAT